MSRTRGLNGPPPTISPAASAAPRDGAALVQRESLVALRSRVRRACARSRGRPPARRRRAAPGSRASMAPRSGSKWTPESLPTTWPSTITAPSAPMPPRTGPACWCSERRSVLVRRSTKRCIERGVQGVGEPVLEVARAALPGRADRRASRRDWRHRRGCARGRAASTERRCRRRSGRARTIWPCIQSSGTRRFPCVRCSNRPPIRRVCSSCVVLRKSGVWQASHSRLRLARSRVRRMTVSSIGQLPQRRFVLGLLGEAQARPRAAARRATA